MEYIISLRTIDLTEDEVDNLLGAILDKQSSLINSSRIRECAYIKTLKGDL